jgi:glutathione S-transferase
MGADTTIISGFSLSPWTVVISAAALVFYLSTGFAVGRLRGKLGIKAPAVTGDPQFERAIRVQGNTLEWLVIFLPAYWMCANFVDARVCAVLGLVWILGRALYQSSYMKDPASRGPGFLIQGLTTLVLLIGAVTGAALQLAGHPLPARFF